jgi:TolA-binding protein
MNQSGRIIRRLRTVRQRCSGGSGWSGADERILHDAATAMKQALAVRERSGRPQVRQTILRTRIARFSTLAAAAAVVLALVLWDRSGGTAWSMGQTVAALREIRTIHIQGTTRAQSGRSDFECWMALPADKADPLKLRFEGAQGTIVVQGDVAYHWLREDNEVQVKHGPQMEDLKFWYRASEYSPWCTGRVLEILKLFTDDWQQVVQTDPGTGQEQVRVTCSYRPSHTSLAFVVDTQTKLVQQGRMWSNLEREGEPELDARTFLYNEELPAEVFAFEIPAGAKVVLEGSEGNVLMKDAHTLWQSGKYAEAIPVFRQVHERFPDSFEGKLAPLFVGFCQYRQGRLDEAVATYQEGIGEYPWRDSWLEMAYFDLGRAYLEQGQKDKARQAFESCLTADEENPNPGRSRLQKVHAYLVQLQGQ